MGQREDLRQHPRLVAPQLAVLEQGGPRGGAPASSCVVEDLSAGGARVLASCRLEPGQAVRLCLAGGQVLQGCLVYRFEQGQGYGYGLRFAASAEQAVAGLWQGAGASARLLVVHPERDACRQLTRELAAAGAPAVAVQSAEGVEPLLTLLAGSLRAVLVEASLAEGSEPDVLALLASQHPRLERVLLSDPMYPCLAIRRRPAPTCDVWAPPYAGPQLRAQVERVLAGSFESGGEGPGNRPKREL